MTTYARFLDARPRRQRPDNRGQIAFSPPEMVKWNGQIAYPFKEIASPFGEIAISPRHFAVAVAAMANAFKQIAFCLGQLATSTNPVTSGPGH